MSASGLVRLVAMAVLGTAAVAVSGSAFAQGVAYVGKWASKPSQCRIAQDKQNAPLILKRRGYDQHETHCTFASVRAARANTWRAQARCSVEGDQQKHDLTLTVKGNRLTIRDKFGARALQRCK